MEPSEIALLFRKHGLGFRSSLPGGRVEHQVPHRLHPGFAVLKCPLGLPLFLSVVLRPGLRLGPMVLLGRYKICFYLSGPRLRRELEAHNSIMRS